jgi:hypothetical protein
MKDEIKLTITFAQAEYLIHELGGHSHEHKIPRTLYAMIKAKQTDWLAQQRAENELRQQLFDALLMPFDQALPIVRKFINADSKLMWDKRIIAWCVAHSKEIAEFALKEKANPEGNS